MNKKERQKIKFISWQIPKHQTVYIFFSWKNKGRGQCWRGRSSSTTISILVSRLKISTQQTKAVTEESVLMLNTEKRNKSKERKKKYERVGQCFVFKEWREKTNNSKLPPPNVFNILG